MAGRFQAIIEARLAELDSVEAANDRDRAIVTLDQQAVGRLSRMDALQQQAMAKATRRRRDAERQRILRAIRLIKTEEYGYCQDCGEPIPTRRLEIDPTAVLCVACAT